MFEIWVSPSDLKNAEGWRVGCGELKNHLKTVIAVIGSCKSKGVITLSLKIKPL